MIRYLRKLRRALSQEGQGNRREVEGAPGERIVEITPEMIPTASTKNGEPHQEGVRKNRLGGPSLTCLSRDGGRDYAYFLEKVPGVLFVWSED